MTTPSNPSRCQTCQNLIANRSQICLNCAKDIIGNLESMYGKTEWSEWARDKAVPPSGSTDRTTRLSQQGQESSGIGSQDFSRRVKRILRYWWHGLWPITIEGVKVIAAWTLLLAPFSIAPLIWPFVSESFGAYAPLFGWGLYIIWLLIVWLLIEIFYKVIGR